MGEKAARVRAIGQVAPEVLLLDMELVEPKSMPFRAGQFLSIRIDEAGSDRRSYSIASHPRRQDGFELLVKLVEGGGGSGFFRALQVGSPVHFTGPMGFFTPDLSHAGDVVFAATGSGIAAALPMIDEVLDQPGDGRVLLYWGLRHDTDVYFRDRLEALAARSPRFAFHVCLSQPGPTWKGVNGRITRHVLDAIHASLSQPVFYLVGNGAMVRDLKQGLIDLGVDRKKQIRSEVFYPASEP